MTTENKILLGVTAAALAGVGIGLLIAPTSGTETRDQIRKGANGMATRLLNLVNATSEDVKEKASEVVEDAKTAYKQAKGYVKAEIEAAEILPKAV